MNGIARQADVEAIEARGMPADLPASTYEMLRRTAAKSPNDPALSFFLTATDHRKPETWTYAALFEEITRAANAFTAAGATSTSVIAYVLPNLPETHFTLWGGEAAGVVLALNPLLDAATLGELLRAAGATMVVTLAPFPKTDLFAKVAAALAHAPSVSDVFLVDLSMRVRGPKRLLAKLAAFVEAQRSPRLEKVRVHEFHHALRMQPSDHLISKRTLLSTDRSSLFCTGGTTGLPKIAVRTHGNEVANAWSAAQNFGDSLGRGKNLFCGLPLFHVNGVMVTGLAPFSQGAHVVLGTPQGYRGEGVVSRFWEIVEHHQIHLFSGVPTLYASLLQVPLAGHKVDSLDYAICGAAPMPVRTLEEFTKNTGARILEGYGLTEGTCISSVNPPRGELRAGSIGLRIPGQAMKTVILDTDHSYVRDCEADEIGAVMLRGPNVFLGYIEPSQNTSLFVDLRDGGGPWLDTGDLGRCDADGYFWLTGRKKELIIRGGHNIDPAAIEEPLSKHPAVHLSAAIGRPDARAGELPMAYVELRPGASVTSDELLAFAAKEILERAAVPKAIVILDKMPLTAIGKIHKPTLKKRENEATLGAALRDAGIAFHSLEVVDDPTRGQRLQVALTDASKREAAGDVLGRFTFGFDFVESRSARSGPKG